MSVNLARHVIAGYTLQEPPLVRLLKNVVFHFAPFTEAFNNIYSQFEQNTNICDPIKNEEFADRILSPESDRKKSIFSSMLESGSFDLVLTFSAGGHNIQYPQANNQYSIFQKMATNIGKYHLRESNKECELNQLRIVQANTVEKLTDLFLRNYNVPLYTIQLDCCRMPPEQQIAQVWRTNLHKMLNFLNLTETGVKGSIKNRQGAPLRQATVTIKENTLTKSVTKNLAYFRFVLPAGEYELEIASKNSLDTHTLPIIIVDGEMVDLGNILLESDVSNAIQMNNGKKSKSSLVAGIIAGFVLDVGNHPIKNAKISLINTKLSISNISDFLGGFKLTGTPFGMVTIMASASGYVTGKR